MLVELWLCLVSSLLFFLLFDTEDGGSIPLETVNKFLRRHGVTFQKIVIFMVRVITSNPA
jgi:hypothetical protein